MTISKKKKPKKKEKEVDFTKITPNDIAKRFLKTPPKPRKKEKDKT